MLNDFLAPLEESVLNYIDSLPLLSVGKNLFFNDKNLDLSKIDIALIGLNEYRGSSNSNLNYFKSNTFRKEFYSLYSGDWKVNLVDLGDVINGNKLSDTYYAVQYISETLIKNNVIPFFIGGSQDLTFPIYKSYCGKGNEINLSCIDNKFDFGQIKNEFNDLSFMSKIILDEKNELNHYSNIGFQTFLNSQEEIDLLDKMQFESYRLGKVDRKIDIIEPCLRNTNIVSIDFKSIKASELNFIHNFPNGFQSSQICTISRYAGISNRVSSIGIFDVFNNEISYALLSQLIWYFIEGFCLRIKEDPYSKDFKGNSYYVSIGDQQLKFYNSDLSQKWWVELDNNSKNNTLIPCNNKDYIDACNQIISERILLSFKRNFV
ncbi:MAG: formimidoylglutamase [Flavobacteriaceae bacterium]|nr:formimidoylglutamase [Flavobacteriaceae bacterium]MDG1830467.1 formimidoylglutamase [Flavobacteriaceae bacterium]